MADRCTYCGTELATGGCPKWNCPSKVTTTPHVTTFPPSLAGTAETITVSRRELFAQGDYISCNGHRSMRVTATKGDTMTVRWAHSWGWIEWLNARLESWIVWPLQRLWHAARPHATPEGE